MVSGSNLPRSPSLARPGGAGELPPELTAEVHSGLLALAMLDPPYVIVVPVHLEWRGRHGRAQLAATALVDLEELRLLAS